MYEKYENKNKNKKQYNIIYNSLNDRSKGKYSVCFFGIPKIALNQTLLKPIRPNTLATSINSKHTEGDDSSKPLKI